MALALFDLDNTLLNGDSDHGWGVFLSQIGVYDPIEHKARQDYYYQQYQQGTLDIDEFLEFHLAVLAKHPLAELHAWREQYLNEVIEPMISSGKAALMEPHRAQGDEIVIVTATNDFITRAIADRLGVEQLIATTAEVIDGNYTGRAINTPCYAEGKVTRLEQWLESRPHTMQGSWFYSDSYNDLPLLKICDNPVAVTPDERLRKHAEQHAWPIID